jgi:hypothetical protein
MKSNANRSAEENHLRSDPKKQWLISVENETKSTVYATLDGTIR